MSPRFWSNDVHTADTISKEKSISKSKKASKDGLSSMPEKCQQMGCRIAFLEYFGLDLGCKGKFLENQTNKTNTQTHKNHLSSISLHHSHIPNGLRVTFVSWGKANLQHRGQDLRTTSPPTRWTPTIRYKRRYNHYKQPYKWVTGVFLFTSLKKVDLLIYLTLPYTFGPQNHEKMQVLNLQHMGYNSYNP